MKTIKYLNKLTVVAIETIVNIFAIMWWRFGKIMKDSN